MSCRPDWTEEFTDRKFGAILADPAWHFKNWSKKGEGRNATAHYPCMKAEDILAMPVADLAAKDAVLFLWVTDPLLELGLRTMAAWGFTYKTIAFTWAKTNKRADLTHLTPRSFGFGNGHWTRANPEMCLLGTRGAPKRVSRAVSQLIVAPRREHSRKPDEVYDRIEALVRGPYLELFARQTHPGWDAIGNQVGLFDNGSVPTRRFPSSLLPMEGATHG